MAEPNRKLAAILSADVVGYSRLMQDDDAATVTTLREYRSAIGRVIDRHKGRVVNEPGDNILAEFPSAVESVQCACEIQQVLKGRNLELAPERRMEFRIGVNLGDVIEEEDGTIYGDGVNIAARMEALADAGGICIASSIYDAVEGKLDFGFDFLGEQQVKNIAKPVQVYRVRAERSAAATPAKSGGVKAGLIAAAAVVAIVVAGVVVWQVAQRSEPEPEVAVDEPAEDAQAEQDPVMAAPTGPSIAVLPFANISGDPEQEYFADGITEELITALTRSPDLIVTARNTSFQYKGQAVDIKEVGRDLGVRYVLEGSVRKAAETIRVTAQLLDAKDGTHLWAETYDRDLTAANIFAVQDEITQQVVGMIAGSYGIISRAGLEQAKRKGTDDLEAYDCVLRLYAYRSVFGKEGHLQMRDCLERAVESDPEYADAWAWLSFIYAMEYMSGYNPLPDPLERAVAASRRAVDADPTSGVARLSHARVYFFLREFDLFVTEAEKAIALSPNNSDVLATMGYYLAFAGEWERGLALIRKAMELSPSYPGWAHDPFFWNYYRKEDYEAALAEARLQAEMMPKFHGAYELMIAAYGHLGRREEARAMIAKFLELKPNYAMSAGLDWLKFNIPEEVVERYREGLREAGLEIPD